MNQWIFKLAAAAAIVIASYSVGIQLSTTCRKRIENLEQLKRLLLALKSRIEYHRSPLYEALMSASEGEKGELADMFVSVSDKLRARETDSASAWASAAETCPALADDDKNAVVAMASALGKMDVKLQTAGIDGVIEYISQTVTRISPTAERDGKMYKSLGALLGLLICVVLM